MGGFSRAAGIFSAIKEECCDKFADRYDYFSKYSTLHTTYAILAAVFELIATPAVMVVSFLALQNNENSRFLGYAVSLPVSLLATIAAGVSFALCANIEETATAAVHLKKINKTALCPGEDCKYYQNWRQTDKDMRMHASIYNYLMLVTLGVLMVVRIVRTSFSCCIWHAPKRKTDVPCYGCECCPQGCPASAIEAYAETQLTELELTELQASATE